MLSGCSRGSAGKARSAGTEACGRTSEIGWTTSLRSSGRKASRPTSWWCRTSSSSVPEPAGGEAPPPASSPTSWDSRTWIPCATRCFSNVPQQGPQGSAGHRRGLSVGRKGKDAELRFPEIRGPRRNGGEPRHLRAAVRHSGAGQGAGSAGEEIGEPVRAFRQGRSRRSRPVSGRPRARIRGFPRNLGTHCGGVVITPGPITDYTHVQISPLGYPVIAWEKDGTEEAGLVKIDLLGNRSLAVLRDTLRLVQRNHGVRLDWESFDPWRTSRRGISSPGTDPGVFYVESPATRQLLTKMQRGDYPNLVIASSIIRPAANQYIRTFVKRLHGARTGRCTRSSRTRLPRPSGSWSTRRTCPVSPSTWRDSPSRRPTACARSSPRRTGSEAARISGRSSSGARGARACRRRRS